MPPYVRRHAAVRLRGLVSTGIIPAFAHGVETERRFQNCARSGNNPLGRVHVVEVDTQASQEDPLIGGNVGDHPSLFSIQVREDRLGGVSERATMPRWPSKRYGV